MGGDALRAMLDAYIAAWRRGDAAACIGFYAGDARMEDPLLPAPLEGRERIEGYFVRGFAERPADTTRELVNVAAGGNRIFFEWIIGSAEGGSRGVSVWEIEDGKVRRDRSYWHEDQGAPAAARREMPEGRRSPGRWGEAAQVKNGSKPAASSFAASAEAS